ncbi:hypothetical protein FSP39_000995 [Pinctada imbricata]|uniref:DNA-directed DNA polymerase n=1 Tax=Pinctada imbricata TaxID=66713 RepID=A0AA88YK45_PINIB|nr:hypothetical protein FSP39_000995 [Pinctada imbricata]
MHCDVCFFGSVCQCSACQKTIETNKLSRKDLKCGYYTCKSCQQYVDPEHMCYAKSVPDTPVTDRKYIFADIEASQRDEIVQCDSGYAPLRNNACTECQYDRIFCQNCATCKHCLQIECGPDTPCSFMYLPQPREHCQECTFLRNECKACKMCQNCLKSSCGQNRHTLVLAVCQTACSKCEEKALNPESKCKYCGSRCSLCSQRDTKTKQFASPPCMDTCGYRERIFHTLYDLGAWIFHENHKGFTVMFHNLSYDGQFLMQYLLSQSMRPSFVIYRGSKIQMFNVQSLQIRVIDSFNFLPMALAKLPKAFQLDALAKGYFPHFFTRREHLNYVGPYPPVQYYAPDSMSIDDRTKFLDWYQNKVTSGEVFDFQKEMIKYCQSDVDILRRACLKFKNLLNDATGSDGGIKIDAFASCTIASLCMEVFKKKFLREEWRVLVGTPIAANEARNNVSKPVDDEEEWLNAFKLNGKMKVFHQGCWKYVNIFERQTGLKIKKSLFVRSPIARPPANGYVSQVKFSKKSIQWLEWLMQKASIKGQILNIQHALNGRGEYKVPGTKYSLDGFVAPEADRPQAIAYEFNGCRYHGCPTCYKNKDDVLNPNTGATASELFSLTLIKEAKLREMGFKVIKIWECQFDSQCHKNDNLRTFIESLDLEDRLGPRDSLMGGRTNGSVLFKRANAGSKIKYVDFTSLYPFINKNEKKISAVSPRNHHR